MTVSIKVNISGDDIGQRLDQISGKLSNLQPAMNEIGMAVEQLVLLGFVDSRDPYGKFWNPIKPRKDGSSVPLRDTGRLMGSITHNADKNSVRIGTNVFYAPFHQLGTKRGITPRKFLPDLGLPVSWSNEIMDTLNSYLVRALA